MDSPGVREVEQGGSRHSATSPVPIQAAMPAARSAQMVAVTGRHSVQRGTSRRWPACPAPWSREDLLRSFGESAPERCATAPIRNERRAEDRSRMRVQDARLQADALSWGPPRRVKHGERSPAPPRRTCPTANPRSARAVSSALGDGDQAQPADPEVREGRDRGVPNLIDAGLLEGLDQRGNDLLAKLDLRVRRWFSDPSAGEALNSRLRWRKVCKRASAVRSSVRADSRRAWTKRRSAPAWVCRVVRLNRLTRSRRRCAAPCETVGQRVVTSIPISSVSREVSISRSSRKRFTALSRRAAGDSPSTR